MIQRTVFTFSLSKLESMANKSQVQLVELLEDYYKGFKYKLSGNSYLINPGQLFFDREVDVLFKAQYIQLAGRRSYQQYRDLGYKHLGLTYFPDLNLQAIKYNPLLITENNKILFKYEEINGT